MREFDAGAKDTGAAKILEAEHESGSAFIGTVVLLDDVVQVLDLTHDDPLPSVPTSVRQVAPQNYCRAGKEISP